MLAAATGGGSVDATPDGVVTVIAEFIVYERPFANDANIGPFDHHELFHPGGVGPSGLVCSPDRVEVTTNEIVLTFDPAGGPVIGTGVLEMSCEYHPGCGSVTRTESLAFRGEYDAAHRHMVGVVDFESSGGETTGWGTDDTGGTGCVESTWVQEPRALTTDWMLDLDANLGFLLPDPCNSDPHQRTGWFTVVDGAGLTGAPVEQVRADDMDAPSCAAGVAPGDVASAGDPEAVAAGTAPGQASETSSPSTSGETADDEASQDAVDDGSPEASAGSDDDDGPNLTPVVLGVAALMLILILYGLWLAVRGHLGMTTDEIVGGITAVGITDPDKLDDLAASLGQDYAGQEEDAKVVRPPQYADDSKPVGTVEISSPVQAVSPTGATLALPPGTSYPAGSTTTADGHRWRSIQVGDDRWWIRADEGGATMTEDWSATSEGTPEVLTPLPQANVTLTERRVVMERVSGDTVVRHDFEPGEYLLGPVESTPTGDRYDVMRLVDHEWRLVTNLPESVIRDQLLT